ncbi:extracellular solute-binding protein [Metabacillus sp. Hm71]|uniref:extracellular solute-binding protein n=1 Tax=Metabacillus sp. Hm71 TaxID=3450743 RepID=UPI003F420580
MRKKIPVFLMTTVLMSSVLFGCKSNEASNETSKNEPKAAINESGFPIVDEKITLSMVGPHVGKGEWKDREYFKEMEKLTNINFKFETPPRDDFPTKKQLLLASGDLPDIFYASDINHQEQIKYGGNGILIPLEDLIDKYAPNIKKMLEERPEVKKAITAPDGHIYALPSVDDQPSYWHMWYNGEWLKNLGVTELPKTTDEFYNLLKRFKTEDPNKNGKADELPLSNHNGVGEFDSYLLAAFGLTGSGISLKDGEVVYSPVREEYKAYLEYMNKLWEEDLFDHESFSQTNPQKKAKGHENLIGVFADAHPAFVLGGSTDRTDNPVFHPLTSEFIDQPIVPESTGIGHGTFAITKENEHPEATIRWVDYSYSIEGADLLHNGVEGTYWEWKDANTKQERLIKDAPSGFDSPEDFRSSISPDWGIGVPIRRFAQDQLGWKWGNDKFGEWVREEDKKKLIPYETPVYPSVYFKDDELKTITRIERDLNTYVTQMRAKFITGESSLSEWDKYVKTIEDMDLDKLIDIYKQAYERHQKN